MGGEQHLDMGHTGDLTRVGVSEARASYGDWSVMPWKMAAAPLRRTRLEAGSERRSLPSCTPRAQENASGGRWETGVTATLAISLTVNARPQADSLAS